MRHSKKRRWGASRRTETRTGPTFACATRKPGTVCYSAVAIGHRRDRGPEVKMALPVSPPITWQATRLWPRSKRPGFPSPAHRNPILLFRSDGSFLLRFETRTFSGLLFQEPPRNTVSAALRSIQYKTAQQPVAQSGCIAPFYMSKPGVDAGRDI